MKDVFVNHTIFTFQDNTMLTATVWRLETGKLCDTARPNNCSHYGDVSTIIPKVVDKAQQLHIKGNKWEILAGTVLKCEGCQGCSQDNITAHYTCSRGNKNCIKNWFGEECSTFCNVSASNYQCDRQGRRTCSPNWFNKDCDQFCDSGLGNYVCDEAGHRVCLPHWYGKNCTIYCNNSAEHFKCNDDGGKVCSRDWYGHNCLKFCHSDNKTFECTLEGDKTCRKNWFGKDCSNHCNNSDARYKCDDEGGKVCLKNWHGENCTKFCNSTEVRYRCDKNGEIICAENWYGENCKYTQIPLTFEVHYFELQEGNKPSGVDVSCPVGMWRDENKNCLDNCDNVDEIVKKYKKKCASHNGIAFFCINSTDTGDMCTHVTPSSLNSGEYIAR